MSAVPQTIQLPAGQLHFLPIADSSGCAHLLQHSFSVTAGEQGCDVPLLPGGHLTFLFPEGDRALLCGPLTAARHLTLAPHQSLFGAQLRCGCGDWLWSESLRELRDRAAALEPYLPGCDRLCAAPPRRGTLTEQSDLLVRLCTLRGARQYQPIPLLRRCLTLIDERGGQLPISELAGHMGCSERYLCRLFHQKVGFSAKTQCELVQLHLSLHAALTSPSRSLLHLAVACGYFDQAHMNRHYRKFLACGANDIRHSGFLPVGTPLLPD